VTTHSYFGQQLTGSVAITFAVPHRQTGAGQMVAAPVDVVAVRGSQTGGGVGHVYFGQQLASTPS
jgi:hypothetical protein